jgi:hypothetical protein
MSWWELIGIYREDDELFRFTADNPPYACPNCGEPLRTGPSNAEIELFCQFDGWSFPRDWVRPEKV